MLKIKNNMKMGREKVKKDCLKIGLLFGILLLFNLVSGQVIGGEVFVASNSSVNPSWQNVFVYDVNNVNDYFEVMVSPEGHRYSFENSRVEGIVFDEGVFVRAEILDFENGFMAGPVEMNLSWDNDNYYSCTDCDIFPRMEFREVVQVKEPLKDLIISSEGEFNVGLNVYDDCDLKYFDEENELNLLCERGCDYLEKSSQLGVDDFGKDEINFVVDCGIGKRYKSGSREIYEARDDLSVSFEKSMDYISEGLLKINYFGSKDSNVDILTDFIPKEFEVLNVSNGGRVFEEDGYYAIEWKNISSDIFDFNYYIKAKEKLKNCEVGFGENILKKRFDDYFNSFSEEIDLGNNDFYFDCVFSEDLDFYLVESVDFEKKINKKIKKEEEMKIELNGSISEDISNVEFREYVPVEFEISDISEGGKIEVSNSNYNVIIWNVEGKEFDFYYNVSSSNPGDYSFASELGGNILEENLVNVPGDIQLGRRRHRKGGSYKYEPENFSAVSEKFPLIDKKGNMTLALYSKNFTFEGSLDLFELNFSDKIYNRSLKFFDGYLIESNLGDNFGKFAFEYDFDEGELKNKGFKNLEFRGKDKNGNWLKLTGSFVEVDGKKKYEFESNQVFREIAVFGVKEKLNLWDRLVEWFWNAFGFRTGVI